MQISAIKELIEQRWLGAALAMLDVKIAAGNADPDLAKARALTGLASRVFSLDAEDFQKLAADWQTYSWAEELASCGFPDKPRATNRGAFSSLKPLYRLMLEVLQLRQERREPLSIVTTAHLIGEYLCALAWEPTLGHAGDPSRMRVSTGERFGTNDPVCPMSSAARATARRSLHAASGPTTEYTKYLDGFHSRLGDAMAVCAMNHQTVNIGDRPDVGPSCPNPCQWVLRGTLEDRKILDARCRLALIYLDSRLVALRHHAPVGHFFGVPSIFEVDDAWHDTWARLTAQWPDLNNPMADESRRDTVSLSDIAVLVSAVAGEKIVAGTLIRRICEAAITSLDKAFDG